MAARTTTFWTFIVILVLLHLSFRIGMGLTVIPDLIVVAALLGARRTGGWQAAFLGLVLGVLADSLSLVGFGSTAVALVTVCYLGSRSRDLFEGESYLFIAVYAFIGAWLVEAIRGFAAGSLGSDLPWSSLFTQASLTSLYTAIAAVVSLIAYRAITGHR